MGSGAVDTGSEGVFNARYGGDAWLQFRFDKEGAWLDLANVLRECGYALEDLGGLESIAGNREEAVATVVAVLTTVRDVIRSLKNRLHGLRDGYVRSSVEEMIDFLEEAWDELKDAERSLRRGDVDVLAEISNAVGNLYEAADIAEELEKYVSGEE